MIRAGALPADRLRPAGLAPGMQAKALRVPPSTTTPAITAMATASVTATSTRTTVPRPLYLPLIIR